MLGLIGIEYEEYNQDSYQGFRARLETRAEHRVYTGDVCADFVTVLNWLCEQGCIEICFNSSFDHFLMDGDKFKWDDEQGLIVPNC